MQAESAVVTQNDQNSEFYDHPDDDDDTSHQPSDK